MNHIGTRIIETERLILRPLETKDAPAMYENWASDPEVTKYLTWPAHSGVEISRMVLRDWVESYERSDYYQWGIVLKGGDGKPIGSVSAVELNENTNAVEIGYCLGRQWWGGGVMTEALKAVAGFFIEQVGANRVEARYDTNNPASGRVMVKAGMTFEGVLRRAAVNNQGVVDIGVCSILAEEWKK